MDSENSSSSGWGVHLPVTLLGVAFSLFFFTQVQEAGLETKGLEVQKNGITKVSENLSTQIKKNETELAERRSLIAQSEKIQERFAEESSKVKNLTTSSAQIEALHKQVAEMKTQLDKQQELVVQSEKTQQKFSDLMKDLNTLAKTNDADAQLIIKSFGIQVTDEEKPAPKPADKADD